MVHGYRSMIWYCIAPTLAFLGHLLPLSPGVFLFDLSLPCRVVSNCFASSFFPLKPFLKLSVTSNIPIVFKTPFLSLQNAVSLGRRAKVAIRKRGTSLFTYHAYLILFVAAPCHLDHPRLHNFWTYIIQCQTINKRFE